MKDIQQGSWSGCVVEKMAIMEVPYFWGHQAIQYVAKEEGAPVKGVLNLRFDVENFDWRISHLPVGDILVQWRKRA